MHLPLASGHHLGDVVLYSGYLPWAGAGNGYLLLNDSTIVIPVLVVVEVLAIPDSFCSRASPGSAAEDLFVEGLP